VSDFRRLPAGLAVATIVATGAALACAGSGDVDAEALRQAMVDTIKRHAAQTSEGISDRVLEAVSRVPRHEFVPAKLVGAAYQDRPLPIGYGQTISQPYIVALMTELAEVGTDDVVLEVGTGSGYQAAILSHLAKQVYTIEIVEPLARVSAERLEHLGLTNVEVKAGDGYKGWPAHAPFDAIVVTAAPAKIPAPLIEQLAPGGRLVIPVGPRGATQYLTVVEKNADGLTTERKVIPVRFVPLTGEH
jgi:protein-L-isoaspartate(D-aspartate) O-methyltransferase